MTRRTALLSVCILMISWRTTIFSLNIFVLATYRDIDIDYLNIAIICCTILHFSSMISTCRVIDHIISINYYFERLPGCELPIELLGVPFSAWLIVIFVNISNDVDSDVDTDIDDQLKAIMMVNIITPVYMLPILLVFHTGMIMKIFILLIYEKLKNIVR